MTEDILRTEVDTYERERDHLLASAEGEFVLIKGDKVLGTFQSQSDAVAAGVQALGNTPFLVRQIVKVESPQNYNSSFQTTLR